MSDDAARIGPLSSSLPLILLYTHSYSFYTILTSYSCSCCPSVSLAAVLVLRFAKAHIDRCGAFDWLGADAELLIPSREPLLSFLGTEALIFSL